MPDRRQYNHVHFIGIGGVGMSALAQIVASNGIRVSGSDPMESDATERLKAAGARIYREQVAENIDTEKPDLVVVTAAVQTDNPEVAYALQQEIAVVSRAEFLGRLMTEKQGPRIAVAGTHGKTTTTSMIAAVLIEGGLDPTVLVGGEFPAIGGNVRIGGEVIVAEACEAYDSFLSLRPNIAVITNIEADHLDYYGTEDRVRESFVRFLAGLPADGTVIWCSENEGARSVVDAAGFDGKGISYGQLQAGSESVWAEDLGIVDRGRRFRVLQSVDGSQKELGIIELNVPGQHNVMNALAAVTVGIQLGVAFEQIASALSKFTGAARRFDVRGELDGVLVVDDYAHHPTEVRATIDGAREAFPGRRIVAVFQPHLYSRTRDFLHEFADALNEADVILVTDIYAAREKPIPGVRAADLVRIVASRDYDKTVLYLPKKTDVVGALTWITQPGDVVLTMGAGDINEVAEQFLASRRAA